MCGGNQDDANFWVSLQKYIIASPLCSAPSSLLISQTCFDFVPSLLLIHPPTHSLHVVMFPSLFACHSHLLSLSPSHSHHHSSVQAPGFKNLWQYWGGWQLEMGAGPVSHPNLGHLLLLCLERNQVNRKGDIYTSRSPFWPTWILSTKVLSSECKTRCLVPGARNWFQVSKETFHTIFALFYNP